MPGEGAPPPSFCPLEEVFLRDQERVDRHTRDDQAVQTPHRYRGQRQPPAEDTGR